ncbi:glycoside hydrolase family 5 protein [Mahella australiensis]|uniref:Glycoside hydrolase family 5 n=1 Tax=Mahella australiensis (strain DSM 15567 / CIP 107919 / 50-1 BON) TaxID=697281 RepID=F4A335_MAHA5|nr:cellulase family glycosylhydrolase [Mahella australiensis]AEE96268.1 glycoside hydrolase family 5 [Mahella australiensis 50-1 BON]
MNLLHVNGKDIVNESGKKVMLRGTCVGGWMNMENFINGYPGTESNLRSLMKEKIGEELATFFFDEMADNFLAEDDFKFIAESGANCVRLAINYRHFEDDENPFVYKESGFKRLDKALDMCKKYNLYAIIDMHAVQGWQNSHWHSDNIWGLSLLWRDKLYQDRFYALWQEIARRYEDRSEVAGYELMNEPSSNTTIGDFPYNCDENYKSDSMRFNKIIKTATEKIREVDKRHIIFVQGDYYGHIFNIMDEPFDSNTVYSCHDYVVSGFGPGKYPGFYEQLRNDRVEESGEWNYDKQISHIMDSDAWKFAQKYSVPLWMGEFGSQYNTGEDDIPYRLASMNDQLKALNELGIHWTTWTYKDCGVMGWVTLAPDSKYMKLIAPVQKMKATLGAENFTGWRAASTAKGMVDDLAKYMEEVIGNPSFKHDSNTRCLSNAVLTGYAACLLQSEYVNLFAGYSKEGLKGILDSFSFDKCVINDGYIKILKERIRD